jgi:protein-S-isoprenylcysteine O-methyltransferase Ste14
MKRLLLFVGTSTSLVIACLGLETCTSNPLGWVLFFAGVGFCVAGSLALAASTHPRSGQTAAPDRSLGLFAPGLLVIGLVSPLEYLYLPASLPRTVLMQEAGLVLFGAGLLICLWARCLLEWWDTGDTRDRADARLTRAGADQIMRYPGYVGLGLMGLGLGVGFASLIGLLVWGLLLLPRIFYRMRGKVAAIGALSVLVGPAVELLQG